MRKLLYPVLATLTVCQASVALAQSNHFIYEAVAAAPVGSWAEYTMSFKETGATTIQRYSLVERTSTRLVLEIEMGTAPNATVMHMEYVPCGAECWKLSQGIIQTPTGRTMPIPGNSANALIKKGSTLGSPLGTQSLKTPSGTFACRHWQQKTALGSLEVVAEFWTNDAIFPIGLARSLISTGKPMDVMLSALGKGAQAKVRPQ